MILNTNQKNAVHLIHVPCLVLAGAGSGKTSVIINKIVRLIKLHKYDPKKIFAITFTNKAAQEIRLRVLNKLSDFHIKNLFISTFHSFGLKIIKKEYKMLGLSSFFTLLNKIEQFRILKDLFFVELNSDVSLVKELLYQITKWKNFLLPPELVHKKFFNRVNTKFIKLYYEYNKFLKIHNMFDFEDLIFLPTLLLKKNKIIRLYWQKKIQHLLVDEYQDTNRSQYELIKLLCNNYSNFTLVGDDDQSIYSWRGARIKNFYLLKKDFPNLNIIKMEQNYRSSGCILHAANTLISKNSNIFGKRLFSTLEYGKRIRIFTYLNEFYEAKNIINHIKIHKNFYNKNYNDYVILYRNNYQAKTFEFELIYQKIPYHIYNGNSFFEILEIKDLLAYLRLIVNPYDDIAFLRIINVPHRKIGLVTLAKLRKLAKKYKLSLFFAIVDDRVISNFKKSTILILFNFVKWIKRMMLLVPKYSEKILDLVIKDIDYYHWIQSRIKDKIKLNHSFKNITIFSQWLKDILNKKSLKGIPVTLGNALLHLICEFNDEYNTNSVKNLNINKLKLMTLHASKGLEFKIVYIVGLEEGTFPHQNSIIDNNISEERRLMYVGITRAKKQLFLSFCTMKKKFGITTNLQPSRFLFELPKCSVIWN